jgi:hypothetical protein
MRLFAVAMTGILLLSASAADAWPWSRKSKFPRAIDSPVVRPKVQQGHKAGKQGGRHDDKFTRQGWGEDKAVYRLKDAPHVHSWVLQHEP